MRKEHQEHLNSEEAQRKAEAEAKQAKQSQIDAFFESLEQSADLNDNL